MGFDITGTVELWSVIVGVVVPLWLCIDCNGWLKGVLSDSRDKEVLQKNGKQFDGRKPLQGRNSPT